MFWSQAWHISKVVCFSFSGNLRHSRNTALVFGNKDHGWQYIIFLIGLTCVAKILSRQMQNAVLSIESSSAGLRSKIWTQHSFLLLGWDGSHEGLAQRDMQSLSVCFTCQLDNQMHKLFRHLWFISFHWNQKMLWKQGRVWKIPAEIHQRAILQKRNLCDLGPVCATLDVQGAWKGSTSCCGTPTGRKHTWCPFHFAFWIYNVLMHCVISWASL